MNKLIGTRQKFHGPLPERKAEGEGGCGVIGLACEEQIAGRHLLKGLCGMRNRGNNKGGGIAAVGLNPKEFNVSQTILDNDYLLAIAYLSESVQDDVERQFVNSIFEVDQTHEMRTIPSYSMLADLTLKPPKVILYFVRVKASVISEFIAMHGLSGARVQCIEDEIVYQNSYRLNQAYYSSIGEKCAFVLSHGKNLLILKMVGYGDDVIAYYKLEDFKANVWIGHHRYPTKGKVWHPGGAHPFIGMHEALVHNGDFANYASICEYLSQRNIHPQFLTDTEVAVLLFDLLHRIYAYPLEYVIEAFAPTTERDFALLPIDKQHVYEMLQKTHMHGSPDGPWFFLIAQSLYKQHGPMYRLIGITDTSMLRPQVFAIQQGEISIGFSASEKQAIDVTLASIAGEDGRFWSCADHYWSARGGSHTDGGAFLFSLERKEGKLALDCTDKFGTSIMAKIDNKEKREKTKAINLEAPEAIVGMSLRGRLAHCHQRDAQLLLDATVGNINTMAEAEKILADLTLLLDSAYPLSMVRRSWLRSAITSKLKAVFQLLGALAPEHYSLISFYEEIATPKSAKSTLIIDAKEFASEGEFSLSRKIVEMHRRGFRNFVLFNCLGHRFLGSGLGPNTHDVNIDIYGSSGDYVSSGIDGAVIQVHGSAQDQAAQIMKEGTLVIHGDVGQAFLYGAKGGKIFVRGNAAGRPLINAVGKPRLIVNGTALDYLAESFMAGDPLKGGGFAVINGFKYDSEGYPIDMPNPYPGNNLFSLASGGAIYIRDPYRKVSQGQLNGGEFCDMTFEDWNLILPYLKENESYFGIEVERLLHFDGKSFDCCDIFRKIAPVPVRALQEEEAWVKGMA